MKNTKPLDSTLRKIFCFSIICLSVIHGIVQAQTGTNFSIGFDKGFKEGFCYNKGQDCLSPLPPLAPLPRITESKDSFWDGYNRGFQTGLDLQRLQGGEGTNPYSNIPHYKFNDYVPQIPVDD